MKLRNKRTGRIVEWEHGLVYRLGKEYCSIKEFADEWEDYKEEYWFIDNYGEVRPKESYDDKGLERSLKKQLKEIGNYFETKEEAERAVEKLKAWKRLERDLLSLHWQRERDGRFSVWGELKTGITIRADAILDIHRKDLDLLFGGEE